MIQTTSRSYYLVADGPDTAQSWVNALMKVVYDLNYKNALPEVVNRVRRSLSDPQTRTNSMVNLSDIDKETAIRVLIKELDETERKLGETATNLALQQKRNESLSGFFQSTILKISCLIIYNSGEYTSKTNGNVNY